MGYHNHSSGHHHGDGHCGKPDYLPALPFDPHTHEQNFQPATTVTIPASQCSTGPVQCCDSTETAGSGLGSLLLGLLGIVVQDLDLLLGVSCSPIDVLGGGTCTSQAVCCEDNAVGGLISIGCIVVTL
ncbi:fungal hydrophobin-domain-containing protein [Rhodocollybia butyracea]|uniref:Hydrophobin n=1 Tax=Rhodocollybia butyracea TaxID=206335 RepID=A0A9P5PFH1_9AGAR|nr:fungal hydrophobin-domain-containing protein [Rhodocollybia butyracea]